MALFDTDVLIDHLRGKEGAQAALLKFTHEKNYCSIITSGEILFGMKENEKTATFRLLESLEEISVEKNIIRAAYEVKRRAKGHHLELYDCIISATALLNNQILVTRNARHYPDKRQKLFIPDY